MVSLHYNSTQRVSLQRHLTRPLWLLLRKVDKLQRRLLPLLRIEVAPFQIFRNQNETNLRFTSNLGGDDEGSVGDGGRVGLANCGGGGEDEAAAGRVRRPRRLNKLAGAVERVDGTPG